MAMTKSVGPRPEPCSILVLMVQRGEIAEGKKFLSTIGGMGSAVNPPHRGLGLRPRSRRNFEHLIPNGVHFGLLFASQFSKVGGDGPKTVPSCSKVGGTRTTGPIGWLRLWMWEDLPVEPINKDIKTLQKDSEHVWALVVDTLNSSCETIIKFV